MMKTLKKSIAILLSFVLAFSLAVPAFAEDDALLDSFIATDAETGDHTTPDEFWDEMTDDNGNIQIENLPFYLVVPYLMTYLFETLVGYFRDFFNGIVDSMNGIFDGLNGKLDDAIDSLPEATTEPASDLAEDVSDVVYFEAA